MSIKNYIDFVIDDTNHTFSINETCEKPTAHACAASTLEKIEKILRENITYKPGTKGLNSYSDKDDAITDLKNKSAEIINEYKKKINNLNFISRLIIKLFDKKQLDEINEKIQAHVSSIESNAQGVIVESNTNPLLLPSQSLSSAAGEFDRDLLTLASAPSTEEPTGIPAPNLLFDSLPNELINKITAYLPPTNLRALAGTCKTGRLFARVEQARRRGYKGYDLEGALKTLFDIEKTKVIKYFRSQTFGLTNFNGRTNFMRNFCRELHNYSPELRNDPDVVMAAIKKNVEELQYASDALRNDPKIVMAAVRLDPEALKYASDALRNNKHFLMAVVQENGLALEHASAELQKNTAIIMAAVRQNPQALKYASISLQNNKHFIMAAVKQNGYALAYAGYELWDDKDIVMAAVQQNGFALRYAGYELWDDLEVVKAAVQQNGLALKYAKALRNDREVVMAAVKQNGDALYYASPRLRNDLEVVKAAVQQNGLALGYAREALRNDLEVVKAAVQQNPEALQYASARFRNDPEMVTLYGRAIS